VLGGVVAGGTVAEAGAVVADLDEPPPAAKVMPRPPPKPTSSPTTSRMVKIARPDGMRRRGDGVAAAGVSNGAGGATVAVWALGKLTADQLSPVQ
jgi:hypothetical protein